MMYAIHFNGGTPFMVDAQGPKVIITSEKDRQLIFENVKRTFVGLSPLNEETAFSGGHGERFDGNTILLQLEDGVYVYVGKTVYSFIPESPIKYYESPVGGSDVPYPFAIDDNENYYLMYEREMLTNTKHPGFDWTTPSFGYYELISMGRDPNRYPSVDRSIVDSGVDVFYQIHPFHGLAVQKPRINLSKGDISVSMKDGTSKALTEDEYIDMLMQFREKIGVKAFEFNVLMIPDEED